MRVGQYRNGKNACQTDIIRRMKKTLRIEDYQAVAEFRHQIRRYLKFSDAAVRGSDLEPRQYQLLLALKGLILAEACRWYAFRVESINSFLSFFRRSTFAYASRCAGPDSAAQISAEIH